MDQRLWPFGPPPLSGSPAAACFEHAPSCEKDKNVFVGGKTVNSWGNACW